MMSLLRPQSYIYVIFLEHSLKKKNRKSWISGKKLSLNVVCDEKIFKKYYYLVVSLLIVKNSGENVPLVLKRKNVIPITMPILLLEVKDFFRNEFYIYHQLSVPTTNF